MKSAFTSLVFGIVVASCLMLTQGASAAVWIGAAGVSWSNPQNWDPPGFVPNGPGAVADFSAKDLVADGIVVLNGDKTAGTMIFGDVNPSHNWIIGPGTPIESTLTLDVSNGEPLVNVLNQAAIFGVPIDGIDGLTKSGPGSLVLTQPNTYSGRTTIRAGTLLLNFAFTGLTSNIIPTGSDLRLGGTLELIGSSGASISQEFSGIHFLRGENNIRVNQNGATNIDLLLGPLSRDLAAVVHISMPTSGKVRVDTPNINGILGAWATLGSGASFSWASSDGAGNIVPYTAFTEVTGTPTIANAPATNVRWSGSTGDATLSAGITDINTLMFTDSARRSVLIPAGSTLRMGGLGGILKTDTSAGEANSLLTVGTAGSFLTAAGTPNSVGELILNASSIAHDQNGIIVNATITNNGAGPVAVVKSGNASALLAASNSYTNGTYINSGRLQTNISGGYGLGPVHVATGGQAFLEAGVHSNNFFIAGSGLGEPRVASGRGALRLGGNGANLAGKVTLINDAQIGGGIAAGNGGVISGQITGPFKLEFNSGTNGVLTLTNPLNNWTGHTIIGPGVLRIGGSGEVIPNGSRQEVILNGDTLSGALSVLDLNGSTETISGLSSTGDNSRTFIRNSAAKPATLKVGFPSTKYAFGGVIEDGSGPVALTIVSNGVQTLSGANRYSGPTIIENGILHLGSSQALPISTHVRLGHIHSSLAQLDLGGFHPIVSRLSSNLLGSGQIINSAATPSVLTVTEGIHFSGTIVGSIALTLLGGHHSLEGPNFYTGPTTVHGGALYVSGSLAPTGDVFVNRGATLGGTRHALNPTTGRVGNLTMQPGSILDPGELFTISNLTISGAEIRYTFGSEGYSERVNVVSTASFNGPSTIFLDNARPGSYALLTADTLLGIPPTLDAPTGTRMTFALNFDTQGDQIRLIVGGSASKSLTWTGANGSAWGVNTTANWTDGAVEEKFFNLDVVRFQDGPTNRSIVVNTTVNPEGVIVDNSAGNDYAISGTGTIGDSDLQGDGNIYKSGSGTLMLGGSTTYNGALLINAGLVRTTGSIAISKSVNIDNEGAFAVEGTATVGEIIGVPNGVVTVGDGAASAMLTANDIRFGSLSIAIGSSAVIRPNGGPGGTSVLNNLAIAGTVNAWTAALDLNNNDAIVRSSAANKAADFARLYNQVKQGFNNGAWTGLGITSGTAATNPSADTGLAVVDNALLGYTDFSGQRATADSILVKYTYYGDIDLNGQVNADDLTVFANNFGRMTGATQVDGDIDFNGAVNADDLTVFANNFNKGVGNPLAAASVTAVPEPGSCVLVLVGVALCFLFLRNGRRSSAY